MNSKAMSSLALCLLLAGCATTGFPSQTAEATRKVPGGKRIEVALAPKSFDVKEVEFHVDADQLPPEILARAQEALPGGVIGDCEIEYHGGKVYYEVTCLLNGVEQEVMFSEAGKPHRWEVEVPLHEVPDRYRDAGISTILGGRVVKAEQILDGGKDLLEYHFKVEAEGIKYKLVVPLDLGKVMIYRETLAEIEVPLN